MKKLTMMILTLMVVLSSVLAYADNTERELKIWVDGKYIFSDTPALVKNGRTQVPVRFVSEELGYDVAWNGDTQTVTITDGIKTVKLNIGSNQAMLNHDKMKLENEVFIDNGRTYVPLRFIAEAFGENVEWDNVTRTAVVGDNFDHDEFYPLRLYLNFNKENIFSRTTIFTGNDPLEVKNKLMQYKLFVDSIDKLNFKDNSRLYRKEVFDFDNEKSMINESLYDLQFQVYFPDIAYERLLDYRKLNKENGQAVSRINKLSAGGYVFGDELYLTMIANSDDKFIINDPNKVFPNEPTYDINNLPDDIQYELSLFSADILSPMNKKLNGSEHKVVGVVLDMLKEVTKLEVSQQSLKNVGNIVEEDFGFSNHKYNQLVKISYSLENVDKQKYTVKELKMLIYQSIRSQLVNTFPSAGKTMIMISGGQSGLFNTEDYAPYTGVSFYKFFNKDKNKPIYGVNFWFMNEKDVIRNNDTSKIQVYEKLSDLKK